MKIPLFDIDYTLIKRDRSKGYIDFFAHAIKKTFNVDVSTKDIDIAGMIDPQIVVELAKYKGVDELYARKNAHNALKHLSDHFLKNHHIVRYDVLPGAKNLLKHLKINKVPIGILTGNTELVGWKKLEKTALKAYIDFAVFGNMAWRRSELVLLAHSKTKTLYGPHIKIEELIIIGDSVRDIICAREAGAKVIAVATGIHSKEILGAAKPDLLVESLEEAEKILNFLK